MHRFSFVAVLVALLGGLLAAPATATVGGGDGRIAFVRGDQVYTMAKSGGDVRQLTTKGKNSSPRWSPDGKRIAYVNEDANGRTNVFVMGAYGANKTKVTTSGDVTTAPAWSPDGGTIAFGQFGFYTFTPPCYPASCPDREPYEVDGSYVHLVKATAPFGTPTLLTVYPSYASPLLDAEPITAYHGTSLAWSPDGAELALVNGDSGDSPDTGLHVVSGLRGATATKARTAVYPDDVIAITGGDCCGYQDWSDLNYLPNGDFGYAAVDLGEFPGEQPPVVTLRYPGFASQQGDTAGAPSPSGKSMAFVRTVGGKQTIWTSTVAGTARKQLVANASQPDWQPKP